MKSLFNMISAQATQPIQRYLVSLALSLALASGVVSAQPIPEAVGVIGSVDSAAGVVVIDGTRYVLSGEAASTVDNYAQQKGTAVSLRGKRAAYVAIQGEDGRQYVTVLWVL